MVVAKAFLAAGMAVAIVLVCATVSTSAQLVNAPLRARVNDAIVASSHSLTTTTTKRPHRDDDVPEGRFSNLRSAKGTTRDLLQLVHSMSMSMSMTNFEDDGHFTEERPSSTSPAPSVVVMGGGGEGIAPGVPCTGDDECDDGSTCACRFNCLFCSDVPMFHVPWYCGTCV